MLLVGRGWSTSSAAPVALAVAVVLATTLFQTPLRTIAVAAGKGIWDAIFVLYAVWPALILYQVANGARAFDAIRRGVSLGAPWLALASVVDMPDPSFTLRIGALMVWIADLLVLPIGMLVASAAGLAAALALSRWSFYRQEDTDEPDRIFACNQPEPSEAEARPDGLQGGIVSGLANERSAVWGLGLIAVAISMIMSLATRWAGSGPE